VGYWRLNVTTQHFYKCPNPDACIGGPQGNCSQGFQGRMCAVCTHGFYELGSAKNCVACPASSTVSYVLLVIIVFCSLFGIILLFTKNRWLKIITGRRYDQMLDEVEEVELENTTITTTTTIADGQQSKKRVAPIPDSAFPKFKILIGYIQILALTHITYDAPWPSFYTKYANAMSLINLDVIKLSSIDCIINPKVNFYQNLLLVTIIPLCIILVMTLITLFLIRITSHSVSLRDLWDKSSKTVIQNVIVFGYVIYTGVTSTIFKTFQCQKFDDGTSWLLADFNQSCQSAQHNGYVAYASVMIVIYSLGFPALLFATLVYYR
jgi:hypothetical protein